VRVFEAFWSPLHICDYSTAKTGATNTLLKLLYGKGKDVPRSSAGGVTDHTSRVAEDDEEERQDTLDLFCKRAGFGSYRWPYDYERENYGGLCDFLSFEGKFAFPLRLA
jgi:hypothetical protein